MPKPPGAMEIKTRKKFCTFIIPRSSTTSKYLDESRSPALQDKRSQEQPTVPTLPPHLDRLIDHPWSPEASREIDRFLWYLEQEFGLFGGAV